MPRLYSSSEASSRPATMIPTAQSRLTQIPTPRLAKKNVSGIEISLTSTRMVAIEPMRDCDQALGDGVGQADAELAQEDQEHGREAEKEDDLPDRSRVPADHRDGRTFALARVPAREGRNREQEAEEEGEPPTRAQACCLRPQTASAHARAALRCPPWGKNMACAAGRPRQRLRRTVSTLRPWPRSRPGPPPDEETPPIDPGAVDRAYRLHRARRAARQRWHREKRWAGVRFWLVLALALVAAVLLAARTLGEIERIFGL